MQKPKSQKMSLVAVALLAFVMIVFVGIGASYAYFQGSKLSEGQFKIGSVGAKWYNSGTALTNSNVYQLAGTTELERGDTNGASLVKVDGSAGGDLRLVANSDSTGQYIRVKPQAFVGKNLVDISNFTDTVNNAYYNDVAFDYVLEAGKTYTLSYNYNYTSTSSDVMCSIGCGTTGYAHDIANKNYTANSGKHTITFKPTATNLSHGNKLYVRFTRVYTKHTATNLVSNVQLEEGATATAYEKHVAREDVLSYLTFRYVSSSTTYVFGSNTFWKNGGDGWYYYINAGTKNVLNASNYSYVCNNIVLSGTYPTRLLGKTIRITFTYEALQSSNSPVASVWGTSGATALGIS